MQNAYITDQTHCSYDVVLISNVILLFNKYIFCTGMHHIDCKLERCLSLECKSYFFLGTRCFYRTLRMHEKHYFSLINCTNDFLAERVNPFLVLSRIAYRYIHYFFFNIKRQLLTSYSATTSFTYTARILRPTYKYPFPTIPFPFFGNCRLRAN